MEAFTRCLQRNLKTLEIIEVVGKQQSEDGDQIYVCHAKDA
jgi:hypothetical protein